MEKSQGGPGKNVLHLGRSCNSLLITSQLQTQDLDVSVFDHKAQVSLCSREFPEPQGAASPSDLESKISLYPVLCEDVNILAGIPDARLHSS